MAGSRPDDGGTIRTVYFVSRLPHTTFGAERHQLGSRRPVFMRILEHRIGKQVMEIPKLKKKKNQVIDFSDM